MSSRGIPMVAKRWEQEVPVVLVVEVIGAGKDGEYLELRKPATLPFLPRTGDELAVGWSGDYMTVETVFWSPEDGIAVWFDGLQGDRLPELLGKEGWKVSA